jgi:hypothetical protein
VSVQVLQNLEAAVAQVGDDADPSQKALLSSRITAAEQANISSPLVRIACVRLRSLAISEAQAGIESAVNHLQSSVSINVQHSNLRAALEAAQDVISEGSMLSYLSVAHEASLPDGIPMFTVLKEMYADQDARARTARETGAVAGSGAVSEGHDGGKLRSGLGEGGGQRSPDGRGFVRTVSKDNVAAAARRRALMTGCVMLKQLNKDTAQRLVEGVDMELLRALSQQADGLLVALGRGLQDQEVLAEHLRQTEEEKAERVCPLSPLPPP